jgi:FkbM family methyltransferase
MLIDRGGWKIPAIDEFCFPVVMSEVEDLGEVLQYCQDFRTAIQAGGNFGIYPVEMAKRFKQVWTVEPDELNYSALSHNVSFYENIDHRRAAFGEKPGKGAICHFEAANCGAHQVKAGNEFNIITIDSLCVKDCDLIQLDIEGFEQFALHGAEETIAASSPVICLELKGIGDQHGYTNADTIRWLEKRGYTEVEHVHNDVVFVRR